MTEQKVNEKITHLQVLRQNLQNIMLQKQQFQLQLNEIESAVSELKETEQAYKIVGNIMVLSDKNKLEEELNQKKEIIELRIKNLEKQETQLKEKADDMQKKIITDLNEDENGK